MPRVLSGPDDALVIIAHTEGFARESYLNPCTRQTVSKQGHPKVVVSR